MAKPIHSMIRVRDEARSLSFYKTAFGLEIKDRYGFDGFALVYLADPRNSDFEVELTVNFDRDAPYEMGDGYGHLAVSVDDLAAEHERFAAAGLKPGDIKSFDHEGRPFARFFFVTDPDGYKIEVLQRGGRFK